MAPPWALHWLGLYEAGLLSFVAELCFNSSHPFCWQAWQPAKLADALALIGWPCLYVGRMSTAAEHRNGMYCPAGHQSCRSAVLGGYAAAFQAAPSRRCVFGVGNAFQHQLSHSGIAARSSVLPTQTLFTATLQDRTRCSLTMWALLPAGCSGLQGKSLTLFGDHVEHLCCHPGYRMLALRNVPQMPAASVGFTTFTWEGTLKRLRQMQVTGQQLGPCSPCLRVSLLLPWQRV